VIKRLPAILVFCALGYAMLAAGQDPKATELGGKPFFIKKTWTIGGEGNWDYLTLDPAALQLFVAHGTSVQVVDVNAGSLLGAVSGMRDAHGIALDDSGELGFVSDGPANQVRIFDRRSLQVVASVPTGPNPRAIVYEPLTKLVFAICTQPVDSSFLASDDSDANRAVKPSGKPAGSTAQAARRETGRQATADPNDTDPRSIITVIDPETRLPLANLLLRGKLGFAQADGRGEVYVNLVDRNRIAHFDAQSILAQLRQPPVRSADNKPDSASLPVPLPVIDWSGSRNAAGASQSTDNRLRTFRLGPACQDPKGLAVDGNHLRLFAACDNQKMEVLNTGTGEVVATLPIGAGTDAIGYDSARGLIYTANGGGLGSVTVIRQDVNDSYAVIQELPTRQRARTLAVNPVSGEVYLVTNLLGFDLKQKGVGGSAYTLPVVQAQPVTGSFQVLVVGN
jgi:DNA-binding beta-propeller fold protein YncE